MVLLINILRDLVQYYAERTGLPDSDLVPGLGLNLDPDGLSFWDRNQTQTWTGLGPDTDPRPALDQTGHKHPDINTDPKPARDGTRTNQD
uniref:Uncharacterized protein n=1 Tax=Cannabis sativa TaxID=3483 RepID=A0A803NVH5_CANSA